MEKSLEQRENERSVDFVADTVKLQGISGQKEGTPTKNLRVGDITVFRILALSSSAAVTTVAMFVRFVS